MLSLKLVQLVHQRLVLLIVRLLLAALFTFKEGDFRLQVCFFLLELRALLRALLEELASKVFLPLGQLPRLARHLIQSLPALLLSLIDRLLLGDVLLTGLLQLLLELLH